MSKGHQTSRQESWGGESQGLWEKAPADGCSSRQSLFCCPQTLPALSLPSAHLRVGWQNRTASVDLEAQAQGSAHLLRTVPSLLPLLDLQQGDGHTLFCHSSVPAP